MNETTKDVAANPRLVEVAFCPGCFASEDSGSWDHVCDSRYCYNCGSAGTVMLPRWAVESIREQASWVGKRYYPNDEDRERAAELRHLRGLVDTPEGDTAEYEPDGEYWRVGRRYPGRGVVVTLAGIKAGSKVEALREGHLRLAYPVPQQVGGQ